MARERRQTARKTASPQIFAYPPSPSRYGIRQRVSNLIHHHLERIARIKALSAKLAPLVGANLDLKPGERVKLQGKKKKDKSGHRTFQVNKLKKDYGPCKP